MDENALETAIRTARHAAERAQDFKPETYAAVLLFELMRSTVPAPRYRNELPPTVPTHAPKREKPYSAAELFASKTWCTEIDKVVVSAFFLERFGERANYTIEEIRACLVAAKVPLPKNVNLAILQAVQKGLMMEIPSQAAPRKAWALTQSGERYVEEMEVKSSGARA
jgi:hypothetical protein